MRLLRFCLTSLIAIACTASGFAQPAVLGNLSVMPGQGATLTATVPLLSGTRLRFWADVGSGLPSGVTMTPTLVEPGVGRLALHFEAAANAPLAPNRLVNIYAGSSASPVYAVNLSVVAATPPTCGAPSVRQLDQSTQAVLVSAVTAGCSVEVWAGDGNGLEPIATSAVNVGATLARLPIRHRLSPGQVVRALQASGSVTTQLSSAVTVENNYVTNRYDNERSGWNPNEKTLTVSSARHLQKICEHMVDGAIRAQPLYVQEVEIGGTKHNVAFAATDSDSVWAFDADTCVANDRGLWADAAGNPSPRSLVDSANGERAVTTNDLTSVWPPNSNPDCAIMLGITATPVVDRTTNTLYTVGLVVKNNKVVYELHALDITTGHDQPGSPVEISDATVQFRGVSFDSSLQGNRPGLLLDEGVLYVGFGSHCDISTYRGWVVAYDANIPGSASFLQQVGIFNTSPAVPGNGVWQSGLGLASDGNGTIYFMTGNGPFDPSTGAYGNTILNLRLPTNPASKEMEVVNFFTPFDWDSSYNPNDSDFGSGGPVLLSTHELGPFTVAIGSKHFLLAGGKIPKTYVLDRDCVNCSGDPNRCIATTGLACTQDDPNLVVETFSQMVPGSSPPLAGGIVAGPAYYIGPQGTRIFYGLNYLPMLAFDFNWFPPAMTPAESAPDAAPSTSPIPAVSSNGAAPGTGVLWAVFHRSSPDPLQLHAYDANNVADNLFSGTPQQALDVATWPTGGPHSGNSFQIPTVIHGKVYVGSEDRLVIFAPLYPCVPIVDCNHAVTMFCRRFPNELVLQRRQAKEWMTVKNPASTSDQVFTYLFDYPTAETATYRVCMKNQPRTCLPEVSLKMKKARCHTPKARSKSCGVPGKAPCFLKKPWPVSPGNAEEDDSAESKASSEPDKNGGKSTAPPKLAPEL